MHKNVTTLKAVISGCAMPSFGKYHSLPPAARLSNAKLPFLSSVPWDTRCVMKPGQFSAQKSNNASEVPNPSWRGGQGSSKAIQEETSASGCAHSTFLAQDCSEVAKRHGSCLALGGCSWL